MTADPVLVERREAAALLTLNRPEKHNALSLALLERLPAILGDVLDRGCAVPDRIMSPFPRPGDERAR
jgi:enoyl-CoA hydratase/carnithine racemase